MTQNLKYIATDRDDYYIVGPLTLADVNRREI